MSGLKMQRSGKVLHSHESPSFDFKNKEKYTDWKLYRLSRSTWLISLHQAFSAVSCLWKAAPFSFSRPYPCLSRGSPSPAQVTEETRNGDGLWGKVLSGRYLYSQEEPSRYIVIIYSIFESFKAISSKKLGNITCPITHLNKRAGFSLLSGSKYCVGLWKIHQFRGEKI